MVGLLSLILIIGNFYSTCSVGHTLHLSSYELCYYYYNDINLLSRIDTLFYRLYVHSHTTVCLGDWLCGTVAPIMNVTEGFLFCEWPPAPL